MWYIKSCSRNVIKRSDPKFKRPKKQEVLFNFSSEKNVYEGDVVLVTSDTSKYEYWYQYTGVSNDMPTFWCLKKALKKHV